MAEKQWSLEQIDRRRAELSDELARKGDDIVDKWTALTAPPEVEDRFHLWSNRAEAALKVYDGAMTGYKLFSLLGRFWKRSSKKSAPRS